MHSTKQEPDPDKTQTRQCCQARERPFKDNQARGPLWKCADRQFAPNRLNHVVRKFSRPVRGSDKTPKLSNFKALEDSELGKMFQLGNNFWKKFLCAKFYLPKKFSRSKSFLNRKTTFRSFCGKKLAARHFVESQICRMPLLESRNFY